MSFGENLADLVAKSTNELHGKHTSWERVRLGDVAHLVNGFAFKSSAFNESEGMPIVRIRDVTSGSAGTFYRGPTDDPRMTFIEDGQIAIGMDGDFNSRLWSGGRALLNQRVCTVQADEEFYSQRLLSYALPGYLRLINEHTSAVTVKHLSSFTVRDIPLPLPPLNEQRRIVEKIETLFAELDKGEESLRQVQTLLARYRQSVLKAAVTGELTADWRAERAGKLEHGRDVLERILQTRRETWEGRGRYKQPVQPADELPSLPQGWVWATVDQVVAVFRNGLSKKPGSEPSRFPILRISATRPLSVDIADVRYYPASDDSEVAASWVEKGDLLFTRYSGSTHFVGVCGQMRGDEPVLHPDKLIKARAIDMDGLDIDFLEIAWNAGETRRHIASKIKTTSGQQGVAGADIKAAPFPLPPPEEQGLISRLVWEALDRVRELQSHCEAELARSSALRQSILKDAFSGRLVPQDPHDEPASELLARIHRSQEAGRAAKR
ncbi:MAG TPA: restriction endonuclease subunit S [Candidatus Luteimonas excrementigallinarum]|nr:restriction endonuclease subunit S [Candidatus Luteimonas excrementigallinarum]